MAIRIPTRNYLTFPELQERWQCSENDLKFAIISSELKPSVRLPGKHIVLTWEESALGRWEISEYYPGDLGYRLEIEVRAWQYLQEPMQTEPFDCQFKLVSDDRNPDKSEIPFSCWYALPAIMKLSDVMNSGVFLLEEVARYEMKHGDDSDSVKEEKPLATRERDTLLTIIAALAKAAKVPLDDYSQPGKAAGYIEGLTAELGARVSKRAIENHLKKISDALEPRMK